MFLHHALSLGFVVLAVLAAVIISSLVLYLGGGLGLLSRK